MKVRELIEELKLVDPDLRVILNVSVENKAYPHDEYDVEGELDRARTANSARGRVLILEGA